MCSVFLLRFLAGRKCQQAQKQWYVFLYPHLFYIEKSLLGLLHPAEVEAIEYFLH